MSAPAKCRWKSVKYNLIYLKIMKCSITVLQYYLFVVKKYDIEVFSNLHALKKAFIIPEGWKKPHTLKITVSRWEKDDSLFAKDNPNQTISFH